LERSPRVYPVLPIALAQLNHCTKSLKTGLGAKISLRSALVR
jgi:hypothetical protein